MSGPKIALGWIRPDMVDGAFQDAVDNFLAFDSQNKRITEGRGFVRALYLDDKRNELVRDFLKSSRADYLMMLDSDIEFEPFQIYQLVEEAEQNDRYITAGLYFSFLTPQSWTPMPVWFSDVGEDGCLKTFSSFKPEEVVVPLAAAGMGFTLIHRDTFGRLAERSEYAEDDWTWFGRDRYFWHGQPKHHGEDVCFCVRAGKLGMQTWGHKGVPVRHWKKVPIDFHFFRAFVEYAKKIGAPV